MNKFKNFVLYSILVLVLFMMCKNLLFSNYIDFSNMMYEHMDLMPMTWNSNSIKSMIFSLFIYICVLMIMPLFSFYLNCRFTNLNNKFLNLKMMNFTNNYNFVSTMSFLILIFNFFSLFSFNWIPMTQSWFILIITSSFLLSIWIYMIFTGGMKLFGEKIPLSWMMINFFMWAFHNLSFFIRFISLPFRMMMNLIVGLFLVDFSKSMMYTVSLISLYEIFVMLVQSVVFIILANMYYTEMVILPEWKSHVSNYNFKLNFSMMSYFSMMKIYMFKIFKKI